MNRKQKYCRIWFIVIDLYKKSFFTWKNHELRHLWACRVFLCVVTVYKSRLMIWSLPHIFWSFATWSSCFVFLSLPSSPQADSLVSRSTIFLLCLHLCHYPPKVQPSFNLVSFWHQHQQCASSTRCFPPSPYILPSSPSTSPLSTSTIWTKTVFGWS